MDVRTVASAHPLTFRVMRLTAATPSQRPTIPFVCSTPEPTDPPDAFSRGAPHSEGEGAPASVGTVAILPASFGSIYASETFRSFISTYNISSQAVQAVSVTIEIHTSSQRRIGLVAVRPAVNLPSREALTHVVEVPLLELGVHALVCAATYHDRAGVSRTIRQVFRFNVLPPLEPFVNVIALDRIRTDLSSPRSNVVVHDNSAQHVVHGNDNGRAQMAQYLVDLRVLNTMPVPVYITSAKFVVNPVYSIVSPLVRPDDPTNLIEELGPALVKCQIYEQTSESQIAMTPEEKANNNNSSSSNIIPHRNASTGVGDTRNFLFYVARKLDSHEIALQSSLAKEMKVPHEAGDHRHVSVDKGSESSLLQDGSFQTPPRHSDGMPATANHRRNSREAEFIPESACQPEDEKNGNRMGPKLGSQTSSAGKSPRHPPGSRQEIGTFSLQWHSGSGEYGRMDNVIAAFEPAVRSAEVELHVAAVPQDIHVQEPFGARCVARNNSDRPIRLYLQVRRDLVGEIVPIGNSGVSLGEVAPACTAECLLTLLPLTRGLHSISGLRVVDIDSRESFNADAPVVSVN
jgi:hypothetical protein